MVVAAGQLAGCGLQAGVSKQLSLTVMPTPTRKCVYSVHHATSVAIRTELTTLSPCSVNALFFVMSEIGG